MKPAKQYSDLMSELLKELAEMSNSVDVPVGAFVLDKNLEVIAKSLNNRVQKNDPTAHAEVVAIREACKNLNSFQLSDCEIYTSCEPCPMCLGAIYWARPKKVYYANTHEDDAEINFDDKFIYDELKIDTSKRKFPFEQMMRTEALEAFKLWKEKQDKISYYKLHICSFRHTLTIYQRHAFHGIYFDTNIIILFYNFAF